MSLPRLGNCGQMETIPRAEKSWPNHVKNEQRIGSEKTYGPRKYWTIKTR